VASAVMSAVDLQEGSAVEDRGTGVAVAGGEPVVPIEARMRGKERYLARPYPLICH
jgi:hypothetical protein